MHGNGILKGSKSAWKWDRVGQLHGNYLNCEPPWLVWPTSLLTGWQDATNGTWHPQGLTRSFDRHRLNMFEHVWTIPFSLGSSSSPAGNPSHDSPVNKWHSRWHSRTSPRPKVEWVKPQATNWIQLVSWHGPNCAGKPAPIRSSPSQMSQVWRPYWRSTHKMPPVTTPWIWETAPWKEMVHGHATIWQCNPGSTWRMGIYESRDVWNRYAIYINLPASCCTVHPERQSNNLTRHVMQTLSRSAGLAVSHCYPLFLTYSS